MVPAERSCAALQERSLLGRGGAAQHPVSTWETAKLRDDFTLFRQTFDAAWQVGLPFFGRYTCEFLQKVHNSILLRQLFAVMQRMKEKQAPDQ